jgi:nitric oxide dioxygenase
MLSSAQIGVIKATVPVLSAHGETLTRHFYRRMFAGNPEVKAFFNPAHQAGGSQQRALAAAICAYAENIENPAALAGAVELIAQKHASLSVLPEHYPIVGKHLLGSIREVLGEGATDEVIDAWAAAYGVLADILIRRESEIYRSHEADFGWRGFESLVVTDKRRESDAITSFYLERADGKPLRPFKPGQYITVRVPTPDGSTTMRNYSLSCAPGLAHYRISVKREYGASDDAPNGHVSNHLHDNVNVGERIEVGPPCGEFTLEPASDPTRPLVLISGGVGITPVLSMLHATLGTNETRDVIFVHGAINGRTHAFRREVLALADAHPRLRVHFRYSQPTRDDRERELFDSEGLVTATLIESLIETLDADFYLCGPAPFMTLLFEGLLTSGVNSSRLRHEFFGPARQLRRTPETAPAK